MLKKNKLINFNLTFLKKMAFTAKKKKNREITSMLTKTRQVDNVGSTIINGKARNCNFLLLVK